MSSWREIEHTADRAYEARGRDLKELFVNAAQGVAAIEGVPGETSPTVTRELEVNGCDRETLLVNWLNELLFLEEMYGELYRTFSLEELSERHLRARVTGSRLPTARRKIKAVTFHGLRLEQTVAGWRATIVVDV